VKGRGKNRTGGVEGHASGRVGIIKGYASGHVRFVMEGPARVRVRLPMPAAIIREPDGREIVLTKPRDVLALGKAVRPHAHMLAGILRLSAASPRRKGGEPVSVSFDLLHLVACLLLALPRSRPGRPRKGTTNEALELSVQHSVRKAARLVAKRTGENPENIRARVFGVKRRARNGGNKSK
jgi:hypothetical protein